MNLIDTKLAPLKNKSQILLFDKDWNFKDSCNTLVNVDQVANVFDELFFFQGYEKKFSKMSLGDTFKLHCVWADFYGETAYYDFHIKMLEEDGEKLYAIIAFDFTEQYEKTIDLQQERNVAAIQKTELQRKYDRVEEEKLLIEKLYSEGASDTPREFVFIKTDLMWVNVNLNSILYFEAYGDYIKVHTTEKVYVIYNRMKNIEEKLSSRDFIRIHRSFIVRIDKIQNIETGNLQINNKILPLGNMYRKELLEKISHI